MKTKKSTPPSRQKVFPGQLKLESLGIQPTAIPTTIVGSLPKSPELIELRYKVAHHVQQTQDLERREKIATETWMKLQNQLGITFPTDGQMNRGDLISFFTSKIKGITPGGLVRTFDNHYYRRPIITEKLAYEKPIVLESWQYAQRLTHQPLKALVTGPYTLMDWCFDDYYSDREELLSAFTEIIRKECLSLNQNGVKIIQISEPALSARPEEFELVIKALTTITKDLKAYVILQHAYGDLSPIWDKLSQLPVDNISIEGANTKLSWLPMYKKNPLPMDITVGLFASSSDSPFTPNTAKQYLNQLLKILPYQKLWISPDPYLRTCSTKQATDIISALSNLAKKTRLTF